MRTSPGSGATGRRAAAALAALVLVLALPYALAGPNLIIDDWRWLANRQFDGWLGTVEPPKLVQRPAGGVVYLLTFGLLGPRPLALYAVQAALLAGCAAALVLLLRRLVPARAAVAVAGLWVVLPNHASLLYWASAVNATVALLLLLVGGLLAVRAYERGTSLAPALVALAVSSSCYEATAVPGAALLVAVPLLRGRRLRPLPTAVGTLSAVATGLWVLAHPTYEGSDGWIDPATWWHTHFGVGLAPGVVGRGLALVAFVGVVGVAASFVVGERRQRGGGAERLVLAGLAVVVAGTAAFAHMPHLVPTGISDRLTVVGGVGAAMVWVGLAGLAGRALHAHRRPLLAALPALAVAGLLGVQLARVSDWAGAGRDAVALVDALDQRYPALPGAVVVGPRYHHHGGVPGMWHHYAGEALAVRRGDPSIRVWVATEPGDWDVMAAVSRVRYADLGL